MGMLANWDLLVWFIQDANRVSSFATEYRCSSFQCSCRIRLHTELRLFASLLLVNTGGCVLLNYTLFSKVYIMNSHRQQLTLNPVSVSGSGCWVHNEFGKYSTYCLFISIDSHHAIREQFRTCHDSSAVAACANIFRFWHDNVIKWKHFPRNWPFVRGIHRSRWAPHTKASDAEFWCFLWSASE